MTALNESIMHLEQRKTVRKTVEELEAMANE